VVGTKKKNHRKGNKNLIWGGGKKGKRHTCSRKKETAKRERRTQINQDSVEIPNPRGGKSNEKSWVPGGEKIQKGHTWGITKTVNGSLKGDRNNRAREGGTKTDLPRLGKGQVKTTSSPDGSGLTRWQN